MVTWKCLKNSFFIFVLIVTFYAGYRLGMKPALVPIPAQEELLPLQAGWAAITEAELQEYAELKDQKSKYEKADEILSKIMVLFLADLGLRMKNREFKIVEQSQREPVLCVNPAPIRETEHLSESKAGELAANSRRDHRVREFSSSEDRSRDLALEKNGFPGKFTREQARGTLKALYQAILWRDPLESDNERIEKFAERSWETYFARAKVMAGSAEFEERILAVHAREEIIHRMYAVWMGRCAEHGEMSRHLNDTIKGRGSRVVTAILNKARESNVTQLFAGGFSSSSCVIPDAK